MTAPDRDNLEIETDEVEMPAWLEDALALRADQMAFERPPEGPTDLQKVARWRDAGKLALSIALLGRQRREAGFVPVSVGQYLRGLAARARVDLGPILRWAGLKDPDAVGAPQADALVRLGRALGMGVYELLLHVRVALAEQTQRASVAVLAAVQDDDGGPDMAEQCEAALREIEQGYEPARVQHLAALEQAVRAAYDGAA